MLKNMHLQNYCLSKGYLYYEDPITKQPKCEFNKEQCLKFSKKLF